MSSPGKIPNGAKYNCLTCHTSGSYAADTQMKLDFLHAIPTKTWTIALAQTDSDGDGFTNGEELQDPTGAWVIGDANPGSVTNVSNPSAIGSQPPTPQFTFSGVSGGTTLTGKVSIGVNISAANPTDVTKVEFALLAFGGQVVYSATDTSAPFCLVPNCTPLAIDCSTLETSISGRLLAPVSVAAPASMSRGCIRHGCAFASYRRLEPR